MAAHRKQDLPIGASHGPRVVALGGGHGLAASLRALRRVTDNLTAIVGVSDNGGSSGRLRQEFGIPPPGDLRMALAALCGDDTWGRTWSQVVQHRFSSNGELAGHSLGNLLITTLWQETGDMVSGLDWVAALLSAHGRVLPVALDPLEIVADVAGADGRVRQVRGQVQVATTKGEVLQVAVDPARPKVCPEAVQALQDAEHIVLGPGSWYTSVMAPLLVPELQGAIRESSATKSLVLNLTTADKETEWFRPETHITVWREHFPDIGLDQIFADPSMIESPDDLADAAAAAGAQLRLQPLVHLEAGLRTGLHDPDLLAAAFAQLMGRGSIAPWR